MCRSIGLRYREQLPIVSPPEGSDRQRKKRGCDGQRPCPQLTCRESFSSGRELPQRHHAVIGGGGLGKEGLERHLSLTGGCGQMPCHPRNPEVFPHVDR